MDLASSPAAATATPGLLLPAVAGPPDDPAAVAAACRQLPFPRFAAASSPRWSSAPAPAPAPATGTGRVAVTSSMAAASEAVVEEERMDLLWEDFNEELALRRARRGGSSWRGDGRRLVEEDGEAPWSSESSDAESEPAGRGCAPVMRPSARAGAGARHCRRRAGTWVLLMRIFRRLFVVEKTIATQRAAARAR